MNNDEIRNRIKYLRDIERLSFPQIAEQVGLSRVTCSRMYWGTVKQARLRVWHLEQYRSLIGEWYAQYPSLRASQVYERLKARGIGISYQSVTLFTRQFRTKRARCCSDSRCLLRAYFSAYWAC